MIAGFWKSGIRLPQAVVSLLAIIVLLLGLGVVIQADSSYRAERAERAQVRARILAANVTAAVDFRDQEAAQEAVSAFRADPSARIVAVYDAGGQLLASFSKNGEPAPQNLGGPLPEAPSSITTFADIERDGAKVGTVYLMGDSLPFYRRVTRFALIAAFAVGVSLIILMLSLAQRTLRQANAKLASAIAELQTEVETREAAESQLRQAQKMEAIGQLTGGIAHDFNNMLAIVLGGIDIADRRLEDTAKARVALTHAKEGATRAADLTRRLLAFARQQPLQPQVIDANQLVAKMTELLERTLGGGVVIETVLAENLWHICADPGQLENALLNLCVNARDAMDGEGTLRIKTRNSPSVDGSQGDEDHVVLTISDTGPGMPPDVLARAFEPFFTTKSVAKGTGLGLAQVDGFVRQTGGYVEIDSEMGHGVSVEIFLPRYEGPQEVSPDDDRTKEALKGSKDEVILVVDDEFHVRQMSAESLRELGYTVIEAANGDEALGIMAKRDDIRMLFTDIVMPGINGRELADKARARAPDLPILFTTGYTRDTAFHDGMVDRGIVLLSKPFTIEQLAQKIRSVLDGRTG
ncbi:MAG: ATP-binding protein [Pseudomonadota bacterium]